MNLMSRLLSIAVSIGLFSLIFYLVRTRKLKEKLAIAWIITGLVILFFAIFENMLVAASSLFGIKTPINMLFFLGIFFIIILNLYYSLMISRLEEQNKKIVQKLSLIDERLSSSEGGDEKLV
jgi:hypothetical protein